MKRYLPAKIAFAALPALVLAACADTGLGLDGSDSLSITVSSDDGEILEATVDIAAPEPEPEQLLIGSCPLVGNLQSTELGENQCQISGTLLEEASLTSDIEWFLEGGFVIGSEETLSLIHI